MGKERCSTKEDGGEMRCIKTKDEREKVNTCSPSLIGLFHCSPYQNACPVFKRRGKVQYPNLFSTGDVAKRKSGFNEIFSAGMDTVG